MSLPRPVFPLPSQSQFRQWDGGGFPAASAPASARLRDRDLGQRSLPQGRGHARLPASLQTDSAGSPAAVCSRTQLGRGRVEPNPHVAGQRTSGRPAGTGGEPGGNSDRTRLVPSQTPLVHPPIRTPFFFALTVALIMQRPIKIAYVSALFVAVGLFSTSCATTRNYVYSGIDQAIEMADSEHHVFKYVRAYPKHEKLVIYGKVNHQHFSCNPEGHVDLVFMDNSGAPIKTISLPMMDRGQRRTGWSGAHFRAKLPDPPASTRKIRLAFHDIGCQSGRAYPGKFMMFFRKFHPA